MTDKQEHASYRALALQFPCHAVQRLDAEAARAKMLASIERLDRSLRASLGFWGADVRLVVVPEYFLSGFPMGEPVAAWQAKACFEPHGPEYEALGKLAQKYKLYLCGNAYETDKNFPDLYFQVCFILNPAGDVVLKYRRLNSMYTPTPHDVWDAYLDLYGIESVFPVVDTPLGRLATLASEEILYPEIARALSLRGAEILLHPTSEIYSRHPTPKGICKSARAVENMCFVVSANSAGIFDTEVPAHSTDGGSTIIDFRGHSLAEAGPGDSMSACADIQLAALRQYRQKPGMGHLLSRLRMEVFQAGSRDISVYPANNLKNKKPTRQHFKQTQLDVISRRRNEGKL